MKLKRFEFIMSPPKEPGEPDRRLITEKDVPPRLAEDLRTEECFIEKFRGHTVVRLPLAILQKIPPDRVWEIACGMFEISRRNEGSNDEFYESASHGFWLPENLSDDEIRRFLIAVYHAAG